MRFDVDGKNALVTGGSRGLGLVAAKALLENGAAKVYISSRSASACEDAAKELSSLRGISGRAVPVAGDFSNPDAIKKVLSTVAADCGGKLHIVIANAGASWGQKLETHPASAFDKVVDLNLRGVFLTIQASVGMLQTAGTPEDPARVIVIGSVLGIMTAENGGGSGTYGYIASKAAVHHLARTLAVELGPRNITVNTIAPGFFPTKMTRGMLRGVGEHMAESNPRQRLGEDEDLAGLVVYLCSRPAGYVNGTVITLDGGMHLVGKL
ncbi:uncharacterized protein V1518DRAFT_76622 [Limtongia smithiae]|uniref:uncharacterized protein n=1 Tax=Limtongia smithiae TaxID=1125753 RepID=UPI0034CDC1BB